MSLRRAHPLLDRVLNVVARRYRLSSGFTAPLLMEKSRPETVLARAIEQARCALAQGEVPDPILQHLFTEALADMIRKAMRSDTGDPAVQAMVLRHNEPLVREYAVLTDCADQDRRRIRAAVNAVAHPARLQRIQAGRQVDGLEQLHAAASSGRWSDFSVAVQRLLANSPHRVEPSIAAHLKRLLAGRELDRLQRLDALSSNEVVIRYKALRERHGPSRGSDVAQAQGARSRKRGHAVEALAAQSMHVLAALLNRQDEEGHYRVVTSMYVPASLSRHRDRAKTEWDVVLLRRSKDTVGSGAWDVCLLVEAKASVEAATTDLPRLLRGLRLLSSAEEGAIYSFQTAQGAVDLRGLSLRELPAGDDDLKRAVLYCCDAAADGTPRLLSAASRMQLLSAPASLEFAGTVANNDPADFRALEALWRDLLVSRQWRPVLHQYPALRRGRELMVHTSDLLAAIHQQTTPPVKPAPCAEKPPRR